MPPRAVTLAVLLFWLATTGWMVYRDQVRESDLPPMFKFDLADEVAAATRREARWEVYFRDRPLLEELHTGMSRKGGLYELSCAYRAKDKRLPLAGLAVHELYFLYRANRKGEVVGLEVRLKAAPPGAELWVEVQADGEAAVPWVLHPREPQEPDLCWAPSTRGLFNPLHPSPTVAGLYPNQTWTVIALDPLENVRPGALQDGHVKTARWRARVTADELPRRPRADRVGGLVGGPAAWAADELVPRPRELPCWRVDYTDQGGALRARAWVRRLDNQVQQQEVYYPEGALKLVRAEERRGWRTKGL